ncbi:MAG: putative bifunctional diguanylate cyclase/phosphodiesterase [Acidimicrobiales bacterium]
MAASAGLVAAVADHHEVQDLGVAWWHLVAAFAVAELAVAHVEIRRETHTISLSEAVLLVGLMATNPIGMVAGRVIGASLALLVRRQSKQKFLFNVALFGAEASLAAFLLHTVFSQRSPGAIAWAFGGLSVLAAVGAGAFVVAVVISIFDEDRPVGLLVGTVQSQLLIAVGNISLAIVGAAAIARSWSNALYLVILLAGLYALLRRQATATERATHLAAISQYTSTLAGLTGFQGVLRIALSESAALLRGTRAAVVVPEGFTMPAGMYEIVDGQLTDQSVAPPFIDEVGAADEPSLLANLPGDPSVIDEADGLVAPLRFETTTFQFIVWDRATTLGRFSAADLALFTSLVAQTQIAGQRAILVDQLEHEAHHDSLTGLPNRLGFTRLFDEWGSTELGTLLVIDLDRFKEINDTLGHATGDRALQILAKRISRILGEDAIVGRLGGDEFVVFNRSSNDPRDAATLARRLVAAIGSSISLDGLSLQIGASIGVALMPEHGDNLTTLLSKGDIAMYVAKTEQLGWHYYRDQDNTTSPRRLDLMTDLKAATELGQLDVWYQPKMRLHDRAITGVEALVRWNHPRYGYVPPEEFVAVAEHGGMMRELTDAVTKRAVADAGRWARQGTPLQVAINLSVRNLLDDTLPDRLVHLLTINDVHPDLIAFEVTETVIMSDRDRVTAVLNRLREVGFELAIDDYGTGYSSLAYLRELPVDVLKIDRAFVSNLDIDAHNEVIVRSTVDLGHNLGLSVVAEGVERRPELDTLQDLGCDYVQGYLLSRPLPIDQFNAWFRKQVADNTPATSG